MSRESHRVGLGRGSASSRLGAATLAVLTLWFGGLASIEPAHAEESGPAITWATAPADENGPDGRAWVELTLDPGGTTTEHLAVTNLAKIPVVFSLGAADGYFTDTGRFNMLPSTEESVDAGTWIDVQESIEVAPGATEVVPFTVTVPANATPGDHPAGIAASIVSLPNAEDSQAIGVEGRVGFRVLTRVSGEVAPALSITDVTTAYTYSWNPFAPGTMTVRYTLTNTGNVRLAVEDQTVSASTLAGTTAAADPSPITEMFADDEQSVVTQIHQVWPIGPITATAAVEPAILPATGQGIEPVKVEVTNWVMPWPQLILVTLLALLATLWVLAYRYRRRVWERRLGDARAAGRAEREASRPTAEPTTEQTVPHD